jgi:WS/DGAT/MGAT family acyltransferase
MRQRVVGNPMSLAPPRWELAADFDLDDHLEVLECPGDGTLRDALDHAGRLIAEPFDRDRPLFHFVLLHGVDGERSALITKAHHAIADGLGMLQIQLEVFDFEPDTDDPELPPIPEADPLNSAERLANAIGHEGGRTLQAARDLGTALLKAAGAGDDALDRLFDTAASALRAVQPSPPLSPLLTERGTETHHDVLTLSLDDLKAAGKRADTRMNAAFVAAVAHGLGRFHDRLGAPCDLLRMGMPVSVRSDDDAAGTGNHLAPIRVELPLTADEPDHLIQIVDALIDAQRNDPAQSIVEPAQRLLARLPATVGAWAFAQVLRGSDFLTSNLPGSPVPMWIGEARMLAQYPFGPTSAAAVNVTLLSYLDRAHVGISIDTAATDRPELLVECLGEGFDWILGG